MQLLTERLFLIPLRPDGMRALLARTTDPELVQPYTDMLDLSLAHPDQWVWYTAWGLYQNDSGDWVGDLCFKGLPENGHPEIGYGLLPEYEHQGYATEAVRAACRWAFGQPGVTAVEAETAPGQHRLAGCPPPGGLRAHGNDGRGRAEVYSAQKGLTALQNQRFPLYISPDLCHNLLY